MLDTEERYGDDRHTKSYPKRKLLLEFDDEAIPPKSNTTRRPGVPLHNRNKAATEDAHDLREHLDKIAGAARSIYGSKGHTPTGDCGRQNNYANQNQFGINTRHNNSRLHATTCPDTEGPLNPCASSKKYWSMNFHMV